MSTFFSQGLLIFLFSIQAFGQITETPTLDSCLSLAASQTAGLKAKDTIYVFDIDNTALKLKNNFGSVQWYRWQAKLIQDNIEQDRVSETMAGLLTIQGHIYQISSTVAPETTFADDLIALQKNGHAVLFHTSRNLDAREATVRELKNNGFLPLAKTLGPKHGYAGIFTYEKAPADQRPVSYQSGIYMSAGQDKGVWLELLLEKLNSHPKHIVFVDDENKNLVNVERAFKNKLPLTLCRYGKVDAMVDEFNRSNKSKENELWKDLSQLLLKLEAH